MIAHTPAFHGLVTGEELNPVPTDASFHQQIPGLESLRAHSSDLTTVVEDFRPDLLHVHNVMNPELLERLASLSFPVVATVHDHRAFCPGRGKWTRSEEVCTNAMEKSCVSNASRMQPI